MSEGILGTVTGIFTAMEMGNEAVTGQRGMTGMVVEGGDMGARNGAEAHLQEKEARKGGQELSNGTANGMREFKVFLFKMGMAWADCFRNR